MEGSVVQLFKTLPSSLKSLIFGRVPSARHRDVQAALEPAAPSQPLHHPRSQHKMAKSSTLTLPEYIDRSALLLKARPQTTRITTTYHASAKVNDSHLTVKTFDPVSGTCIKYTTDRAAEVGRIMSALGSLGRYMVSSQAQAREDEGR
ncbi:hypothetical protein G7K_0027-t2 [Saitoella complicata NRRL Y-17804]|uniref:SRP9 domain-containing protein n=1 Tax=Saitoella complicata (strain BCRC 22490 / CBS 7301 / JCM 7358 / NBRC 10748 / NRRL Y-17804) TaxID=698492 RepID=A0A0E9N7S5_SAICN|nr:hypothetical protein G7K_0027-t2 [Saitoella complicata NRRL Y-17804]